MKNYVPMTMLFLFLVKISSKILLVPEKASNTLSECLIYILNRYFNESSKISIVNSNEYTLVVTEIAKNTDLPIQINGEEIPKSEGIDKTIPSDLYVIMNESINIFKILTNSKWTPSTQFLVTSKSQSQDKIINVFRQFWENNVINVLLLVDNENEVQIFTFAPFNQYDCAIHKPELLATYTSGQLITKKDIIQKGPVTNLNGCLLNAGVLDSPPNIIFPNEESKKGTEIINGIEGRMLMEFAHRLNFKLNASLNKDYGWVEPTPTGAIGDVYLKKSHFACGNIAYNPQRFKYFDMSDSISCDIECISWAVPIGSKKSQAGWISLFVSGFSNDIWYVIIGTFISIVATFRILSKVLIADRHRFDGNVVTILYTFKSFLGGAVSAPKSSPLKFLFFTWLWYCFIIITAYQAFIGSKLTVPFRPEDINTFEDLLESDLHISGMRFMFRLLSEAQKENENLQALGKTFKPSNFNYTGVIEKLIYDRDIAFVGTMSRFMYNVMQNSKAKGMINFMKECVRKYYPVMLLQKNSPLTFRVNHFIRTLFESGIICHWKKQLVQDVPPVEPSVEKLSLVRMKGLFYILAAGLMISLFVFLAERVYYWYSSRDLSRKIVKKICRAEPDKARGKIKESVEKF